MHLVYPLEHFLSDTVEYNFLYVSMYSLPKKYNFSTFSYNNTVKYI